MMKLPSDPMSPLEYFFRFADHRLMHKWEHYFDIYHRHLTKFRGRDIKMLEIGVAHGGSEDMWRDYFGASLTYVGVDINPRTPATVHGNAADPEFLKSLKTSFDIVIDDGSHTMKAQKNAFRFLYPWMAPGGVYLCEDTHTSYIKGYGNGRITRSFMEEMKSLVDELTWIKTPTEFTCTTQSMHFYDSVVVIERLDKPRDRPYVDMKRGRMSFDDPESTKLVRI